MHYDSALYGWPDDVIFRKDQPVTMQSDAVPNQFRVSRHRRDRPSAQVEEDQVGQTEAVKPFSGSNEQGLAGKGGKYSKGDPWTSHVCKAGNLITAQNPQSADACAAAVIEALA